MSWQNAYSSLPFRNVSSHRTYICIWVTFVCLFFKYSLSFFHTGIRFILFLQKLLSNWMLNFTVFFYTVVSRLLSRLFGLTQGCSQGYIRLTASLSCNVAIDYLYVNISSNSSFMTDGSLKSAWVSNGIETIHSSAATTSHQSALFMYYYSIKHT